MAAGFIVPLTVALAWAIWFLLTQNRRERHRHVHRGQGEAVTVDELVEETIEQGEPLRLNWSEQDEAKAHGRWRGTRPYAQDQLRTEIMPHARRTADEFPTAELPKIED